MARFKKIIFNDDDPEVTYGTSTRFGPEENMSTSASPTVQAQMAHEEAVAASGTATRYITDTSNGIWVTPEDSQPNGFDPVANTRGWRIADAIELFLGTVSHIKAWIDNGVAKLRIGPETSGHAELNANGMDVYTDTSTKVASFSDTVSLGLANKSRIVIDPDVGIKFYDLNALQATIVPYSDGQFVITLNRGGVSFPYNANIAMNGGYIRLSETKSDMSSDSGAASFTLNKGVATITASDEFVIPTRTYNESNHQVVFDYRKVNGHTLSSDVTVTKSDVGLGNVDNVSVSSIMGRLVKQGFPSGGRKLTTAANSSETFDISATKSGYTPIAIAGWRVYGETGSNASFATLFQCYLDGNTIKCGLRNHHSSQPLSNTKDCYLMVYVLYKQD